MPRTKISEFSSTPASNTDIDSINISEGCAPSGINDAIRELMAQLKDWQSGTSNDPYVVGSSGSLTLNQGTANGVAYLNGSKVVTSGSALTFDGTKLTSSASGAISGVFNRNTSSGATLDIQVVGGSVGTLGSDSGGNGRFDIAAGTSLQLRATGGSGYISFDAANAEQMRLTSTGLGIGTSSPASIIHAKASGNYGTIVIDNSSTTGGGSFAARQNGSTKAIFCVSGAVEGNTSSDAGIFAETGGGIRFYTNGTATVKATLDSSGNLGLGVTPSAWAWPNGSAGALQLQSGAAMSAYNATTYLSQNWYYNAGEKYIANGFATRYEQTTGKHAWYTAASGTAGNAVSWTQAMTLTAAGNLALGGTTASSVISGTAAVAEISNNNLAVLALNCTGGKKFSISSQNSSSLVFYDETATAERCRIGTTGDFQIGTSGLSGKLAVESTASTFTAHIRNARNTVGDYALYLRLGGSNTNGTGSYYIQCDTDGVGVRMNVYGNGDIQNINNSYGALSDIKLKENITDATPKLANLMQVRIRNYNLIGEETKQIGVVAQELEQIFPKMVEDTPDYEKITTTDEDGKEKIERVLTGTTTKSVKYSVFVPMLIKAIQEQQVIIESLKARLDAANL